jgi:hypothetical protein
LSIRNNRGDIYHIPKRGDFEVGGGDVGNLYNTKHTIFRLLAGGGVPYSLIEGIYEPAY